MTLRNNYVSVNKGVLTPGEVINKAAFGETYFRDIYSSVTNK